MHDVMKPKLLTALQPSDRTRAVVRELRREDSLEIECVQDCRVAVRRLTDGDPPGGVLAQLDRQAPGFLELLATIDRMTPRIPVLGTANGDLVRDLPVETSRGLPLLDLELSATDFTSSIVSAISTSSNGGHTACRQGIDYLLPAILCRRSVSLEMVSDRGLEVSVDLVGGDVWNAYAGELEAALVLDAVLFEPVSRVEIRTLQMIPGERQLGYAGVEALGPWTRCTRPGSGRDAGECENHRLRSTQEIDMHSVIAELRSANTPSTRSEDGPESPDDRFERLLATGIEASLSRDYPRARRAFEEALILRPDDRRASHNLERIRRYVRG